MYRAQLYARVGSSHRRRRAVAMMDQQASATSAESSAEMPCQGEEPKPAAVNRVSVSWV